MLTLARKRLQKDEEDGFTLIELMVVVLIIAILLAIAIPTFLGAQDRARDRAAQSDLRNGITAAKTIATDDAGAFNNVTVSSLTTAEGSLSFAAGTASTTSIGVVGGGSSPDAVLLYTQSESDTWYGITAAKTGAVKFCKGTAASNVNTVAGCTLDKW